MFSRLIGSSLLAALTAPILTALLTALGVMWKERRARRDQVVERRRGLAEIREEIDAISAWVRAYDLVSPPEARSELFSRAQSHLDQAYSRLAELLSTAPEAEAHRALREVLLLARPFHARSAKVLRVLYYLSLAWAVIWLPAGLASTFNGGPGYGGPGYIVFGLISTFTFSLTAPVIFNLWATRVERRAPFVPLNPAVADSTRLSPS